MVLVLVGIAGLVVLIFLAMPRPPKEGTVIQNFYKYRPAFEQLRDMLKEDSYLSRVAGWGVETRNPLYLGEASMSRLPTDRYRHYLALLQQVGGKVATRDEGQQADLGIIVWTWGWAGDTRHMGVCWKEENPTNQISMPDDSHEERPSPERRIIFKHIDEKWYVWADF